MPGIVFHVLTWVGCVALAAYAAILGVKFHLARRYAASHPDRASRDERITVLQPILSGDPALERVLATNVRITSPHTVFCWLLDQDDAVAREVADRLAAAFPGRIQRVVCPPSGPAANPKTTKLERGLREVATPFVAVLDDDTMLAADSLPRAMAALDSCTLYTGLPRYLAGDGYWSSLLAHFVNNNSILTYLPMAQLQPPITINGMFYVMRTEVLRDWGGFAPILPMLCDDYALAKLVRSRGGRIHQSIAPQVLQTTIHGPAHYVRVMHRWMLFANLLLGDQSAGTTVLIIALLGLPPALLWLGFLSVLGGPWFWGFVPAVLLLRHILLGLLHRRFFGSVRDFRCDVSVVSELLQPLHLGHACMQRTIRWRSRRIRTRADGTFTCLPA